MLTDCKQLSKLHALPILSPTPGRVIVYEGQPSREATARSPQSLLTGKWEPILTSCLMGRGDDAG